jgi:hypothetical protein
MNHFSLTQHTYHSPSNSLCLDSFLWSAMIAGTLPSDHDDRRGEMMFWLFEPTTQLVPDTMVIWYDLYSCLTNDTISMGTHVSYVVCD